MNRSLKSKLSDQKRAEMKLKKISDKMIAFAKKASEHLSDNNPKDALNAFNKATTLFHDGFNLLENTSIGSDAHTSYYKAGSDIARIGFSLQGVGVITKSHSL